MARDTINNFTKATIELLRRRSGNRCSHPDCKNLTASPQETDPRKVNDTGIAAHICAAAENGPRFDSSLSAEQIRSIENAIWLCSHHATIIDREPEIYPVELLKEWKRDNENLIRASVNEPILTSSEVKQEVANRILASAGVNIASKFSMSIRNITESIEETVNKLDPRVSVNYSYIDGIDNYHIRANQTETDSEPVKINFLPENVTEFDNKINDLLEHGMDFTSEIAGIDTNSQGLNYILPNTNESSVLSVKNPGNLRTQVYIQDEEGNLLINTEGVMISGHKTFSILTKALNGLFAFNIEKFEMSSKENSENIKIHLNFDLWNGKNVLNISNFKQVYNLYRKMSVLDKIFCEFHIENQDSNELVLDLNSEVFESILRTLNAIDIARKLSVLVGIEFTYHQDYSYSEMEFEVLLEYFNTIVPVDVCNSFRWDVFQEVEIEELKKIFTVGMDYRFEITKNLNSFNIFGEIVDCTIYIYCEIIQPLIEFESVLVDGRNVTKISFIIEGEESRFTRKLSTTSFIEQVLGQELLE